MSEDEGIKIVLNGTVETVKREMTFEELTQKAFPDVQRTEYIDWEVDYRDPADPRSGERELEPRETLTVTRGMVIDVSYTDKS